MKDTSISEVLEADDSGGFVLRDREFTRFEFGDFSVSPALGQSIRLENLHFDHCSVSPGTCVIREGAILRDVLFSEFQCGDAMHISSSALLERVKVKGENQPQMVWLKPNIGDTHVPQLYDEIEWALDISEFAGQVSITGIPTEKVRVDLNRHVIARADWLTTVDWEALGIGRLSYWRILAKKVASAGSTCGVFSLPQQSHTRYEVSMNEFQALKETGLIST